MQFSNTTQKDGIIQRIEDYTNLGDGVISGDDTLLRKTAADVNETQYDLIVDIMQLQDSFDWDDPYRTDYPIATTPLTTNRDYQFDQLSFLKLKRVDITYDGINWERATPFDSATYMKGFGNDTQVDQHFDTSKPMYDPKSFGFWLYPKATAAQVADGALARIEFSRAFDEFKFDDTEQQPAIDRPFHDLIAIGASLKWAIRKGDQTKINNLTLQYERGRDKMIQHYADRNEDKFFTFTDTYLQDYS